MGVVHRKGPRRPRGSGGMAQGGSYENSTHIVPVHVIAKSPARGKLRFIQAAVLSESGAQNIRNRSF